MIFAFIQPIGNKRRILPDSELEHATMADDNFIRVMCDFNAGGLWNRQGSAMMPEQIGLSPALTLALRAWQGHYDEYEPGLSGQQFDWERFEETGRAICKLVQIERPDLHVVYGEDG